MPSAPLSKINHCSSLYSKHETGLLSHLKFRITIIKLVITCVKRSEVRATTKYYSANQWLFAPQDSRETKFLNWLRTCKLKITLICFQCSQECFLYELNHSQVGRHEILRTKRKLRQLWFRFKIADKQHNYSVTCTLSHLIWAHTGFGGKSCFSNLA